MNVFNCKVIQYANGLTEIRKYSSPIGAGEWNETIDDVKRKSKLGKLNVFKRTHQYCENPFTNETEWLELFDDDVEKAELQRVEHNKKVSFNRTKQHIYSLSRQCNWEYFITLTFSSNVVDRYDFDACMKKTKKWLNNQRNRYAKELKYLFVPEQHKDGAWHLHGLIADCGNMSFVDSGKKNKGQTIFNLSGWKFGFSTATKVEDVYRVSSYITKYITKELCDLTKGKHRYFCSQNIPKPIETSYLLESNTDINFVDMVAYSVGNEIDYTKRVQGFIDVDYIYIKCAKESEEKKNE